MRCRGIFIAEVAIALALVGFMAAAVSVSVVRQNRAAGQLAQTREATRLAEQALFSMQSQDVPFPGGTDIDIQVIRPEIPSDVPGWAWVRVDSRFRKGTSQLTGLVREDLLQRATSGGQP